MTDNNNQPPTPETPAANPAPATPQQNKLFKILGLRRRQGRFIKIIPNGWGFTLIGILFGLGSAGFAEYSMKPDFCQSCHLMQPYYQAWHQSTHKNVACVECHFKPGVVNTVVGKWQASSQAIKYITQTYGSKPHAEVHDESCMREGCHERRLLEGKVQWKVPTQRGGEVTIRFDHKPHLTQERRGKQLRCVSCHSQIVQGQHIVVTLDTCYQCHFNGVEHGRVDQTIGGCRACHDAPKSEIRLATGVFKHSDYLDRGVTCENCHSDAVKGTGEVPRQVCWNCHNLPSQIARYGESKFIHQQHVTEHKVECVGCHLQIQHSLTAGAGWQPLQITNAMPAKTGNNCNQCHEQTHGGPAELYQGTGGRGVPDMPSPMFRAHVTCIGCHKTREKPDAAAEVTGQTFVTVQDSCNYCHGTKYSTQLDEWRKTINEKLVLTEIEYFKAKSAVEKMTLAPQDELQARRLLDDADHNIRLVKLGHGVHNVNYSTALLNAAMQFCKDAMAVHGAPAQTAGIGGNGA